MTVRQLISELARYPHDMNVDVRINSDIDQLDDRAIGGLMGFEIAGGRGVVTLLPEDK